MKYTHQQLIDHAMNSRMKTKKPIFKSIFQMSKEEIIEIAEEVSNSKKQEILKEEFESQYNNFKLNSDKILEDKESILQQLYKKMQNKIQQSYLNINQIQNTIPQQIVKPFKLVLMRQNCMKQQESCYALAFNHDSSILIAGCNSKIKIYQFINEELKENQIISVHQEDVRCLIFMKKRKPFISGSKDGTIIIWSIDNNNQWYCQQKLEDHNERILCLIINDNEDLLISSSWDKTIKFWNNKTQWVSTQTIAEHSEQVWGISLSPSQTKLISCGNDRIILILVQIGKGNIWIIVQKINVEVRGYRICLLVTIHLYFNHGFRI